MEDEEFQRPKKPMLYFQSVGMLIPLWAITSVEKEFNLVGRPLKRAYQIVINRSLEAGKGNAIGERVISYFDEKVRDEEFDKIIETLENSDYKVNTFR